MHIKELSKEQLLYELGEHRRQITALKKLEAKHKQTAKALRKSEDRFRKIFDSSNDAIFVMDPAQDKILDCNSKACSMLAYRREELLSAAVSAIHPKEMAALREFAQTVFKQGSGWTNELTCLTKSGETLPAEISASIIEIDDKKYMLALVRDVTERKHAEMSLRESEDRYRSLVEQAGDAIFVSDEEGRIIDVNQQACVNLGYLRDQLLNMSLWQLNPEKWSQDNIKKVISGLLPGKTLTYESYHRRKDGTYFPVEIRVGCFETGGRRLNLDMARDITERKQAEAALRESEERLARILESAMDAIVAINGERRIVLFNTAAENVFACPASEAIGTPVDRFLSEDFLNLLGPYLQGINEKKESKYMWLPEGLTAIHADGRTFPVEGTVSQVEAAGEKLFTLILRNIDARKKAEAQLSRLQQQNIYLQEEIKTEYFGEIIGGAKAMKAVFSNMEKVAGTDSTVLLMGETGTGKELIARAIHKLSQRKDSVLVKVNCGALPEGLVESELFGHEKGAFTGAAALKKGRFELADGGTAFLDEVGELPLTTQTKLLRVLQEQEFERVGGTRSMRVDVRVIAATNRDLEESIKLGAFRADLFYRLNIFPIQIPPLRQRMDDLPLLVNYFVRKISRRMAKRIDSVTREAMDQLMNYAWPGNVRELANILERAVILCDGNTLELQHIGLAPEKFTTETEISTLENAERQHIVRALKETDGVVSGPGGAARLLGINRSTLLSRMKKLGIDKNRI